MNMRCKGYTAIGNWKGYKVYVVKRKDVIDTNEFILVDDFTGEMVLGRKVIAILNLNDYSVEDTEEPYIYKNFTPVYNPSYQPIGGLNEECPHSFEKMAAESEKSFEIPIEKVKDLEKVLDEAMHSNIICGIDFDKIVKESLNVEVV